LKFNLIIIKAFLLSLTNHEIIGSKTSNETTCHIIMMIRHQFY